MNNVIAFLNSIAGWPEDDWQGLKYHAMQLARELASGAPPEFQREMALLFGLPTTATGEEIHAAGKQLYEKLRQLASGAPPQKEREEETRVIGFPEMEHGDLPRRPTR